MSGGEIAALVAAGAFAVLVALLPVPILKLGRTLDEATLAIRNGHERAAPPPTAVTALEQVGGQLERVDGTAADAPAPTAPPSGPSGPSRPSRPSGPMVKVAAISYGVRRAAADRWPRALDNDAVRGRGDR